MSKLYACIVVQSNAGVTPAVPVASGRRVEISVSPRRTHDSRRDAGVTLERDTCVEFIHPHTPHRWI